MVHADGVGYLLAMDRLTPEQRHLNMSRVKARDTKPELLLRRSLHAAGLRYRLHCGNLPGRPDLVFRGRRAVVFVHGCFWHGHDCRMFRLPATRPDFWRAKIEGNRARDARSHAALRAAGWRVLTIWECALRGPGRRYLGEVTAEATDFLSGELPELEVSSGMDSGRVGTGGTSAPTS